MPTIASLLVTILALALSGAAGYARAETPVRVGILGYGTSDEYRQLERDLLAELRRRPERPPLGYEIRSWGIAFNSNAEDAGIESIKAFQPDIVMLLSTDPVEKVLERIDRVPLIVHGQGHVRRMPYFKSTARPGGRVTGFLRDPADLAKRVEMLQGFCTSIRRIGFTASADLRTDPDFIEFVAVANDQLRLRGAVIVPVFTTGIEIFPALPSIVREQQFDALFISLPPDVRQHFNQIVATLRELRIPHIYSLVSAVERGGAFAAQPAPYDIARTGAEYISRIAHGEPPGQIPVQIRRAYDIAVHTERISDFRGCDPRRIAKIATRFYP